MTKKILLLTLGSCLLLSSCTKKVVETANERTIASFDQHSIKSVLSELIQVDIDAYHVYNNAAKSIKDQELKVVLSQFASKHEEHVNKLSKVLLELGGHPPSFSRDFKGFITSGYMNIKIAGGKARTLEAIETNEIISNRYYKKALTVMMPRRIKDIISSHLHDEKSHLDMIYDMQSKLKNKSS